MRLLILSDLHLEFAPFSVPAGLKYDVVILAGDIHNPGADAIRWAAQTSTFAQGTPVVFVAGNHEYYRGALDTGLADMRKATTGTTVHLLNGDEIRVGGVRFIGATLWTDFAMPIGVPRSGATTPSIDIDLALAEANRCMNDFRLIHVPDDTVRPSPGKLLGRRTRLLTAEDTLRIHLDQRAWLCRKLREAFDGPTVVITHHAPASGSVHPQYAGDSLTPAFASDLPREFFEGRDAPVLWVHGHIHSSADYMCGACRVIANPRGYPRRGFGFENPDFNPGLVMDMPIAGPAGDTSSDSPPGAAA